MSESMFSDAEKLREAGARVLFAFAMVERKVAHKWADLDDDQREDWRSVWDKYVDEEADRV